MYVCMYVCIHTYIHICMVPQDRPFLRFSGIRVAVKDFLSNPPNTSLIILVFALLTLAELQFTAIISKLYTYFQNQGMRNQQHLSPNQS